MFWDTADDLSAIGSANAQLVSRLGPIPVDGDKSLMREEREVLVTQAQLSKPGETRDLY
jgi:hypothetical protein